MYFFSDFLSFFVSAGYCNLCFLNNNYNNNNINKQKELRPRRPEATWVQPCVSGGWWDHPRRGCGEVWRRHADLDGRLLPRQ